MKVWWKIWGAALGLKLALAAWLPLSPDEAYYWIWSQHPRLSYYDHPPMVAQLIALGDALSLGGQMLRWPAVLLAHLGLWFWRDLFKDWLTERQQLAWLVLVCLMPLPGLGSIIVTPDLPLMFSWSLMLWCFKRLIDSQGSLKWGLAFGAAFGLGILSKYMAVLIIPIAAYWWWTRRREAPLGRWLPAAAFAAVAVSTPVWLWNLQNDFASFRFQLHHGLAKKAFRASWVYEYVFAQLGLLFPVIAYWAARSRLPRHWRVAAWFPLGFFFFTSFRGYVEANWPVMAHPLVLALSIQAAGVTRWHRAIGGFWFAALVLIAGLVALPEWPEAVKRTKLRDLREMNRLAEATRELEPLFTRSYQTAAKLSYEQGRPVYKLRGMNRQDFYDTLPGSLPTADRFFLIVHPDDRLPEPWSAWRLVSRLPVDGRYQILELEKP